MSELGDATRHFWLTQGVARALGLSFTEAMLDGRISASGYADLVNRCRGCAQSEACLSWLGSHGARSERAPEFCMNGRSLETLARRGEMASQ